MAWLLVQTVDEVHPHFFLNLTLPKRGDVLHVHTERNSWAPGFIDPTRHQLIEVPGEASSFVEYLLPTPWEGDFVPATTQPRRVRVDLPPDVTHWTREQLTAATRAVPLVTDPAILWPESD